MDNFQVLLVEGRFYEDESGVGVETDSGLHLSVSKILQPLAGERIQLAVHHLPPDGIQPGKPGAGSCLYPGGYGCPVHHDRVPDHLLSVHAEGVLREDPWRIEKFDGSVVSLPLWCLPGHYGRIAGSPVIDIEAMKDQLSNLSPEALNAALQTIGVNVEHLQETLGQLGNLGKG